MKNENQKKSLKKDDNLLHWSIFVLVAIVFVIGIVLMKQNKSSGIEVADVNSFPYVNPETISNVSVDQESKIDPLVDLISKVSEKSVQEEVDATMFSGSLINYSMEPDASVKACMEKIGTLDMATTALEDKSKYLQGRIIAKAKTNLKEVVDGIIKNFDPNSEDVKSLMPMIYGAKEGSLGLGVIKSSTRYVFKTSTSNDNEKLWMCQLQKMPLFEEVTFDNGTWSEFEEKILSTTDDDVLLRLFNSTYGQYEAKDKQNEKSLILAQIKSLKDQLHSMNIDAASNPTNNSLIAKLELILNEIEAKQDEYKKLIDEEEKKHELAMSVVEENASKVEEDIEELELELDNKITEAESVTAIAEKSQELQNFAEENIKVAEDALTKIKDKIKTLEQASLIYQLKDMFIKDVYAEETISVISNNDGEKTYETKENEIETQKSEIDNIISQIESADINSLKQFQAKLETNLTMLNTLKEEIETIVIENQKVVADATKAVNDTKVALSNKNEEIAKIQVSLENYKKEYQDKVNKEKENLDSIKVSDQKNLDELKTIPGSIDALGADFETKMQQDLIMIESFKTDIDNEMIDRKQKMDKKMSEVENLNTTISKKFEVAMEEKQDKIGNLRGRVGNILYDESFTGEYDDLLKSWDSNDKELGFNFDESLHNKIGDIADLGKFEGLGNFGNYNMINALNDQGSVLNSCAENLQGMQEKAASINYIQDQVEQVKASVISLNQIPNFDTTKLDEIKSKITSMEGKLGEYQTKAQEMYAKAQDGVKNMETELQILSESDPSQMETVINNIQSKGESVIAENKQYLDEIQTKTEVLKSLPAEIDIIKTNIGELDANAPAEFQAKIKELKSQLPEISQEEIVQYAKDVEGPIQEINVTVKEVKESISLISKVKMPTNKEEMISMVKTQGVGLLSKHDTYIKKIEDAISSKEGDIKKKLSTIKNQLKKAKESLDTSSGFQASMINNVSNIDESKQSLDQAIIEIEKVESELPAQILKIKMLTSDIKAQTTNAKKEISDKLNSLSTTELDLTKLQTTFTEMTEKAQNFVSRNEIYIEACKIEFKNLQKYQTSLDNIVTPLKQIKDVAGIEFQVKEQLEKAMAELTGLKSKVSDFETSITGIQIQIAGVTNGVAGNFEAFKAMDPNNLITTLEKAIADPQELLNSLKIQGQSVLANSDAILYGLESQINIELPKIQSKLGDIESNINAAKTGLANLSGSNFTGSLTDANPVLEIDNMLTNLNSIKSSFLNYSNVISTNIEGLKSQIDVLKPKLNSKLNTLSLESFNPTNIKTSLDDFKKEGESLISKNKEVLGNINTNFDNLISVPTKLSEIQSSIEQIKSIGNLPTDVQGSLDSALSNIEGLKTDTGSFLQNSSNMIDFGNANFGSIKNNLGDISNGNMPDLPVEEIGDIQSGLSNVTGQKVNFDPKTIFKDLPGSEKFAGQIDFGMLDKLNKEEDIIGEGKSLLDTNKINIAKDNSLAQIPEGFNSSIGNQFKSLTGKVPEDIKKFSINNDLNFQNPDGTKMNIPAGTTVFSGLTNQFGEVSSTPKIIEPKVLNIDSLKIDNTNYKTLGGVTKLGPSDQTLMFDKMATVSLPNVPQKTEKLLYSEDKKNWKEVPECNGQDPKTGSACYNYNVTNKACDIKTYHMEYFAPVIKDEKSTQPKQGLNLPIQQQGINLPTQLPQGFTLPK